MAAADHIWWPKIIFDCISRHFRSIRFFFIFFHIMAADVWESHFSPFQINTQLLFLRTERQQPSSLTGGGYIKYEIDGYNSHEVMACTSFFSIGHFGFPILAKIDRVLPLWVGCVEEPCVKCEFDMGIGVTVTWNTSLWCAAAETASTPKK